VTVDFTTIILSIIATVGTTITAIYGAKYAGRKINAMRAGVVEDPLTNEPLPEQTNNRDLLLAIRNVHSSVNEIKETVDEHTEQLGCIDEKVIGCVYIHYRTNPDIADAVFRGKHKPPSTEEGNNPRSRRPRGPRGPGPGYG